MTINLGSTGKGDASRPSSSVLARQSLTLDRPKARLGEADKYCSSADSSFVLEESDYGAEHSNSNMSCSLPEFEDVVGLEQKLEEMSPQKQKQFIFLHSIVNSSSDDSHLDSSDEIVGDSSMIQPLKELYNFRLLERPIPLPEPSNEEYDPIEVQLRSMLMVPRQVSYSIPLVLKHLLCTDDNLIGFEDNITLERVVRRKLLADIIPMCSQGSRTFLPLEMDFSPTHAGQENVINISNFVQKLADKFQPRINSFFNTRFQLSYTFEDGKYKIMYGIFEDHSYFTEKTWNSNYIDLHVFSRYLSKFCFSTAEVDDDSGNMSNSQYEREWKSFVTMGDIFNLVDYLLKGKSSFIQSNSHLLKHIKNGGSLRSAAEKYDLSVRMNKHRILSNVRKYIKGKRIMSAKNFQALSTDDNPDRDFHCGLFDQVMGYYNDLGINDFQESDGMYVIELRQFEDVIRSIADKYVYEKYVLPASSRTV
ncbi:hypothetical protein HG536_0G03410 [Torulaspora globosa]|uniref:Uncharacterized protein n=1 Tax=Torulaspora globosa TaxID=48254 RepID=A0A7G3ZLU3_9SACH|nr:uncharacterized protein HG536_0G03410 [Torulaspora globosa]QLL34479.1 hypothetical protein HG536_0G03410 [Torulaspora globosa]